MASSALRIQVPLWSVLSSWAVLTGISARVFALWTRLQAPCVNRALLSAYSHLLRCGLAMDALHVVSDINDDSDIPLALILDEMLEFSTALI